MRRCSTGRTGAATWCGRAHSRGASGAAGGGGASALAARSGAADRADRISEGGQTRAARDRAVADRRAAALLQEGAVGGLSFGYRVREAKGESPRS
jgi:hypothetical protein